MMYMCRMFRGELRGELLGLEVQHLKVLGVREVLPDGVLTLQDTDPVAEALLSVSLHRVLSIAMDALSLADHIFLSMVIAFPVGVLGIVFILTVLLSSRPNTGTLPTSLTPVLDRMLTLCLFIDVGETIGGHLAGGFRLLKTHDQKRQVVLQS